MRRALSLACIAALACGCGGSHPASSGASALVDPAVLERGEYLAHSVAGCGECHTPRDATGNLDQSMWLAGVAHEPPRNTS